jgi:hypothetical protein
MGPNISHALAQVWGKSPLNFNLDTTTGETPFIQCPLPNGLPSTITCSPTTIVSVSPAKGLPLDGGEFKVTLNKRTNWVDAKCRITGRFVVEQPVLSISTVNGASVLTCEAEAGFRPFLLEILVDDAVVIQSAFSYGYVCPPGYESDADGNCTECPVGTIKSSYGPSCEITPLGQYSDEAGATSATQCPEGTSSENMGKQTILACNFVCPAGTYDDALGCLPCPAGTYSEERSTSCTSCPSGWISTEKSAECTPCPAGTTGIGEECVACNSSHFSSVEATGCSQCPEGQTNSQDFSGCEPCPSGTYRNTTMKKCTNCTAGSASVPGSAFCSFCPIGYFSTRSGSSTCSQCPEGQVTDRQGSSTCFTPTSDFTPQSYHGGIALTIIGSCFIIFVFLLGVIYFGIIYPRQKAELEGISRQMGELAKSST